jgi:hypothetical protein
MQPRRPEPHCFSWVALVVVVTVSPMVGQGWEAIQCEWDPYKTIEINDTDIKTP